METHAVTVTDSRGQSSVVVLPSHITLGKIEKYLKGYTKVQYSTLREVRWKEESKGIEFIYDSGSHYLSFMDMQLYHSINDLPFTSNDSKNLRTKMDDVLRMIKDPTLKVFMKLVYDHSSNRMENLTSMILSLGGKQLHVLERLVKAGYSYEFLTRVTIREGKRIHEVLGVDKWFMNHIAKYKDTRYSRMTDWELGALYSRYASLIRHHDYGPAVRDITRRLLEDFPEELETWKMVDGGNDFDVVLELVLNHEYNLDRLIEYIYEELPRQGLDCNRYGQGGLRILHDYADMAQAMGVRDKYPRYLRSQHDILAVNYRIMRSEEKDRAIRHIYRQEQHLSFAPRGSSYGIYLPSSSQDIVHEGSTLHHCVGSYVDRIINGHSRIVFLRHIDAPEEPFVTVEVTGDRINHAATVCNGVPDEDARVFLDKYAKYLKKAKRGAA